MKQKGEFYKVKKSGFSMLLLLICVSMLSVMPVSAARKKSRYDLQFSDLKVNKKKLKAGEKCEISMKVKNKGTGKIQRLPFFPQICQLPASLFRDGIILSFPPLEFLGISSQISARLQLSQNRIQRRFLDRRNQLHRLADLITVGILLFHDRKDQTFRQNS